MVETRGSALDDAVNSLHENGDDSLSPRLGWPLDQDRSRGDSDPKPSSPKVCDSLVLVLISLPPRVKCSVEDDYYKIVFIVKLYLNLLILGVCGLLKWVQNQESPLKLKILVLGSTHEMA